jgi:hypothetical protein
MRLPWRRRTPDIDNIHQHLREHYPEGAPADQLRGLILCVRRRYTGGYTPRDIAERARMPVSRVADVFAGRFAQLQWGSFEAVLRALDASPSEMTVAVELFDAVRQASPHPTYGPRRGDHARPGLQPLYPTPSRPDETTVPIHLLIDHDTIASSNIATGAWSTATADVETENQTEATITSLRPPDQLEDSAGGPGTSGSKDGPDPMRASTVKEFVQDLGAFRIQKGKRPFREIEEHCEDLNSVLEDEGLEPVERRSFVAIQGASANKVRRRLPTLPVVRAYVAGAGGSIEDLLLWEQAWKRLAIATQAA